MPVDSGAMEDEKCSSGEWVDHDAEEDASC